MKFNFRKIASALASTAMVGATVGLAAAASFPSPFVDNGVSDVAIVYGSNLDLGAVTDVSSSLSASLASSGSVATTVTSEAYPLFTTSTPLELNNSINSVRTSVVDSDLPSVLGDSDFSGNVDASIEFRLNPGSNPRVVFGQIPTTNDDATVGVSYSTTSGNYLYNATATFSKAVNFTHTDSEGESLNMFGQEFVVASATDTTDLVLFRSATKLTLSVGGTAENPSEVIVIDGETFTIELVAATDTSATIKVTDSQGNFDSKEINEAASKKISGLEIAVDTTDESTATNIIQAQIIVGANKLTLTDGSEVKQGTDDTAIQGTNVDFNEAASTNPHNLTKLTVQNFAADGNEDAIRSGEAFIDPVFASFRLALTGLSIEADDTDNREVISIDVSGNDKVNIDFTNHNDNSITNFEWVNNESSAWGRRFLGSGNDWQINVRESAKINQSAYAVVGNEETGYLVELTQIGNDTGTPGNANVYTGDDIVFKDVFSDTTWTATINTEGTGDITIGGKTYTVKYWDDKADPANDEYVQLNYPDSTGTNDLIAYPTIETGMGANLMFYEPLLINLSDAHLTSTDTIDSGSYTNVTNIRIPDGSGYTNIVNLAHPSNAGGYKADPINQVTVGTGGTGAANITNNVSSADGTIGPLTWNVSSGITPAGGLALANDSSAWLMLEDMDGTVITDPAIIIFEDQDESNNYNAVIIRVSGNGDSNNGVGVSDVDFSWNKDADMVDGSAYGASGFQRDTNDKLYDMMDLWGTLVTTDQSTSDQYTAEVNYPKEQVVAQLYFDSLEGTGSSVILGDVKVMDTELETSGMQTKNLVAVGGSCVNSLSKTLTAATGNGCEAAWTAATGTGASEWVIETFANPWSASKVATLVAGYEQGDTTNAAAYLTTQSGVTTNVGDKWTGTTSAAATLVSSGSTA
jgi:hypothetical protein